MRVANFDRVEPPMPTSLPIRLAQDCAPRSAHLSLVLMLPAALGAATIAAGIVWHAILAPEARALLPQRPTLALEVLAAVALLAYLVILPAQRLFARLATRTVEITHGTVHVTERGPFTTSDWQAPLASYSGVAHHVRASLAGTRHELILVHPEREKSILLSVAPRTSQSEVARVATLLGHTQISASELYRFKGLRPRAVTQPLPDPAHA